MFAYLLNIKRLERRPVEVHEFVIVTRGFRCAGPAGVVRLPQKRGTVVGKGLNGLVCGVDTILPLSFRRETHQRRIIT